MSNKGYSAVAVPVATATPVTVEVVSPATLSEGYVFQAVYNGVQFPVTVPAGGIKEGQKMSVPFVPPVGSEGSSLLNADEYDAVQGSWKDGLCDCCRFGCFHPSFLNAWCFPQILMAQVLTRMKMDWLGNESPGGYHKTFRIILCIFIAFWLFQCIFTPASNIECVSNEATGEVKCTTEPGPVWQRTIYNTLGLIFGLYTLIVLTKLRSAVRKKYSIPAKCCQSSECVGGVAIEDCCCSFCCGCCTVAQVARHTANYEEKRALCCSKTGLPETIPVVVV